MIVTFLAIVGAITCSLFAAIALSITALVVTDYRSNRRDQTVMRKTVCKCYLDEECPKHGIMPGLVQSIVAPTCPCCPHAPHGDELCEVEADWPHSYPCPCDGVPCEPGYSVGGSAGPP